MLGIIPFFTGSSYRTLRGNNVQDLFNKNTERLSVDIYR